MQHLSQMLVQQQISHVRPHAGGICLLCLGSLQAPDFLGSSLGRPCSCFPSLTCHRRNCESSSAEMCLSVTVCDKSARIAQRESMGCPGWARIPALDPWRGDGSALSQSLCSCKSDHIPVKSLALITVGKLCCLPPLPFSAAFWFLDKAHWAEYREPKEREAMTMACRVGCSSIGFVNE